MSLAAIPCSMSISKAETGRVHGLHADRARHENRQKALGAGEPWTRRSVTAVSVEFRDRETWPAAVSRGDRNIVPLFVIED